MKQWKTILFFIPWIALLVTLLLWSMGIELNLSGKRDTEIFNSTTILEKVEAMGKLELVKYNFKEIFDYQALSSGKITGSTTLGIYDYSPDIKAVLIATGEAAGCIDLRKLNENDIRIKDDTLFIQLPDPEVCYYKLDMEKTRIYDFERKGWWNMLFPDDDEMKGVIEKAYRAAERQILSSALEGGILEQTMVNAELVLVPVLEKMTLKKVVLVKRPIRKQIIPENK